MTVRKLLYREEGPIEKIMNKVMELEFSKRPTSTLEFSVEIKVSQKSLILEIWIEK